MRGLLFSAFAHATASGVVTAAAVAMSLVTYIGLLVWVVVAGWPIGGPRDPADPALGVHLAAESDRARPASVWLSNTRRGRWRSGRAYPVTGPTKGLGANRPKQPVFRGFESSKRPVF